MENDGGDDLRKGKNSCDKKKPAEKYPFCWVAWHGLKLLKNRKLLNNTDNKNT